MLTIKQRIKSYRLHAISLSFYGAELNKINVIQTPKELDPRVIVWKGASILGRLETSSEFWVAPKDWVRLFAICSIHLPIPNTFFFLLHSSLFLVPILSYSIFKFYCPNPFYSIHLRFKFYPTHTISRLSMPAIHLASRDASAHHAHLSAQWR